MTFYSKKFAALLLCINILAGLTSCNNNYSDYSNTDNVRYTISSTSETTLNETITVKGIAYIVNINTGKFHYPDCQSVEQMNEKNKRKYVGDRDDLISKGYEPCKRCEP